ncbi:DUF2510 domain-containing protein [Streptomyces griseus]|uniref:DUF2510 domain-containing protein n=1 Tax=Streptomyces sp. CMC78 TaxID=3231512 RepID=A0AB33KWT1_9ACTN|nr:DUF2510 domain-containing protein [Streptomyces fimicarius]WTC90940.1 DUF2510 domain-containing protein [Streptomyces griseus]WTD66429.1 DUF2510 domain-containing protein [Streptomyces griseus]
MSYATPPGWYPDTGAPGTERWWDGTAWTAHTRPLAAPAAPEGFGPPSLPLPHQRDPHDGSGGGNRTKVLAVTLSGVLVLGAAVTGAILLGRDDSGTPAAPTTTTSAPAPVTSPTATATTSAEPEPDADPSVLVDQLNGVTLPVPEGWEKPESTTEDVPTLRTEQSYDCPGAASFCYHGTVTTHTARSAETDPKALAEADIVTAADKAYEEDAIGRRLHGGITSHKVLRAQELSVAGRTGYLVRWQVTTGKGPGGYVQSLVFPSSVGAEIPVIVRFAFDAGVEDLPLSLMDTITKGIRPLGDSGTSGGVGASVGP